MPTTLQIAISEMDVQEDLRRLNDARLRPRFGDPPITITEEVALRETERQFLESERAAVAGKAMEAPIESDTFMAWFEGLREAGPGQNDPLFPWLATTASIEEIAWFLAQEVGGEAGFEDLVALTQVKMPVRAKLEMARNYWDEMGRGKESGMHGPMLDRLAAEVGVVTPAEPVTWEAVALGNLLVALAANRDFAYHSVGALGVVELTAPGRAAMVNEGLTRLAFAPRARRYYALHATLDLKHSAEWNAEVIEPLVRADARLTRPIAEGALMRLNAGARCFERYRQHFGI
jgi:hypothetical protein